MEANMKKAILAAVVALTAACGGGAPQPSTPSTTASTEQAATPTKPDHAKAVTHLKQHVKYPATRAEILQACADTPEFTAGERKWCEVNLPEGTYQSADDVIAAEKL
jgi:hypothetical protein